MQMVSGPGLGFLILSVTFAAVDWVMSLDPAWYSTIYGLIFVASWSLSALAFTTLVMTWLSARAPMNTVVQRSHFHDWGNLTLALVMLWTYFAFSQYLIIWSANLPEETTWYVARTHGGWGTIALDHRDSAIRISVHDAVVAGDEKERAEAGDAGRSDSGDANPRRDLAG